MTTSSDCTSLWREIVMRRAGWRCERCGDPATDAHHEIKKRKRGPHRHDPRQGFALCVTCHEFAENRRTAWRHEFAQGMASVNACGRMAWCNEHRRDCFPQADVDYDAIAENLKEMLEEAN